MKFFHNPGEPLSAAAATLGLAGSREKQFLQVRCPSCDPNNTEGHPTPCPLLYASACIRLPFPEAETTLTFNTQNITHAVMNYCISLI